MGVLDSVRVRNRWHTGGRNSDVPITNDDEKTTYANDKDGGVSDSDSMSLEAQEDKEIRQHPDQITANAQSGVQKAEAAALVWSKPAVIAIYAWIWVGFFMLALQQSILSYSTLTAYSTFSATPAYTTATILSIIIGGVLKLPIAKILNIWGRAEGLAVFVTVYVVGIIILASASGPDAYAAGYVLYWIGYDSIYIILDIFIADTSGLRNRAFAWAFASTPFICTAFTGPLAAQSFLTGGGGWRWAAGAFAIIQPCVYLPLIIAFKFYQRKAEKMGILKHERSGRTILQSIVFYFHEFDIIGMFIVMAAFILFLLPFSLETYKNTPYNSATFITMVVLGVLMFGVFYIWERFFARVHFMRWELLRDRTVLGACLNAATLYFSFYCWDTFYYYFVLVVYNLSIADAGYMTQIYNVGSCFWGVVFGVWVCYTKHFKYFCLFFGAPIFTLGAGLMIYFRGNDKAIGYLVMCQIFIAFGGGTLVIGQQMAVMAAADRDGVPMLLALLYLFSDVGGAIGSAVISAIYGNVFPEALSSRLPTADQGLVQTLYKGGYLTQLKYAPGTTVREASNYAWGRTQYYGCIAATAVTILSYIGISAWKNYDVSRKQNKGTMI